MLQGSKISIFSTTYTKSMIIPEFSTDVLMLLLEQIVIVKAE